MMKRPAFILLCVLLAFSASAAPRVFSLSGKVTDADDGTPLIGAVVHVDALWAISDANGVYHFDKIQPGTYKVGVELLGYVSASREVKLSGDVSGFDFRLNKASLAIEEVTVVASRPKDGLGTSHNIGREALDHLQLSNITDMASLLPGGKTVNPDLTSENSFSVRSGGLSAGNAAFSTALEVDGVRVGNNASFSEPSGVDTRNVQVENIESVEVLSGVLSAEYGDLGSGMVKIHTKHGRTPLNVSFSTNPRTRQVSVSKGIGIGAGSSVLNVGAEWVEATRKLTSPYESYTRRGISLTYSGNRGKALRFEAGLTGNLGGMNSEDDPDAFKGEYSKAHDNVLRARTSATWQPNLPGFTSLKFEGSVNYNDKNTLVHGWHSNSVKQPAVHSEEAGYHIATILPEKFFSDQVTDSRELDYAASLKYGWDLRKGDWKSAFKAGIQWKAEGNVGEGEYYKDPSLAADGYRPRPYSEYPYMHNVSFYVEENLHAPFGIELSAGIRVENVYVNGSEYSGMRTVSPRLNAKWALNKAFSIRGGWGLSGKLPPFHILYPKQEYLDKLSVGFSHGSDVTYVYYTIPYTLQYNPDLRWQRNSNAEIGVDLNAGGFSVSLAAFRNVTLDSYGYGNVYTPVSYLKFDAPATVGANPVVTVDATTGAVTVDGTLLAEHVTDRTFVRTRYQKNGAPITRQGIEATVDFPAIKPIRTSFRLDGTWSRSSYDDHSDYFYYNDNWSHTSLSDRSYEYVGIYANGGNSNLMISGVKTERLDANLTSITHITEARLIVTCRVEVSFLRRSRNLPAGGKDELWPVAYMDLDGNVHPFTSTEAAQSKFSNLIKTPSNDALFLQDGYSPYASANLSITKEIGSHVSLSFFANNFTNSRPSVTSKASGIGVIFTPELYYGLTCRIKL